MAVLGVGIVGSGSVTQGIHLPTLARLADLFEVRSIMDVDELAVRAVADRAGARYCLTVDDLLDDPAVDVIAVCSPHSFHASHVIAACRAGKRAVLCEKPFAMSTEEAEEIASASRATGVPVLVGAMHGFDPSWVAVREAWGDLPDRALSVRSSVVLPFNDRFEAWSTEVAEPARLPVRDLSTPAARAAVMTARLLALAIHDLPLVRVFLPSWRQSRVTYAELLAPTGYSVLIEAGGRAVQLLGSFRDHWQPEWEFEVIGPDVLLTVDFTPSYVHAGSATARLASEHGTREFGDRPWNGYEEEWRALARAAADPGPALAGLQALVDDLSFAVLVSQRAGDHMIAIAAQ